jgi:NAD(P)-dependent dehydrogenase (short-subunit alcohol dehydrogenase family)
LTKKNHIPTKKIAVVTGGSGFLGQQICLALLEDNRIVYNFDLKKSKLSSTNNLIHANTYFDIECDITNEKNVKEAFKQVTHDQGRADILINNAAIDHKVLPDQSTNALDYRFENFDFSTWQDELSVGLTGAIFCSKYAAKDMIKNKSGIIVNVSSDLGVIAPDQRIYMKSQHKTGEIRYFKPFSYSVIKHGIIGLTKYLATYLAEYNIRVNALSPGSIFNYQDAEFVLKLRNNIPLNRLAEVDEYKGAIQFLTNDASSYMTGHNLIMDGGRSVW